MIYRLDFEPSMAICTKEFEVFFNNVYFLDDFKFTIGIYNNKDNLDFYILFDDKYDSFIKKKFKLINENMEFIEMEDPLKEIKKSNLKINAYELNLLENDSKKQLKNSGNDKHFLINLIQSMECKNISLVEFNIVADKGDKFSEVLLNIGDTFVNLLSNGLDFFLNTNFSKIKRQKSNLIEEQTEIKYRFFTSIKIISAEETVVDSIITLKEISSVFNDLALSNQLIIKKCRDIYSRDVNKNILSSSELSQMIHFPTKNMGLQFKSNNCKKVFDNNIPTDGNVFGEINSKLLAFQAIPISIETYEEKYHEICNIIDNICKPKLVVGNPGSGKSEMIITDFINYSCLGYSTIIMDPKNDTQQRILEALPEKELDRLIYLNLGDMEYPPSFNIFKKRFNNMTENSMICTSIVSILSKQTSSWGHKMEQLCTMAANAVLLLDECTLNEFYLLLHDEFYRQYIINFIENLLSDPNLKSKAHIKKIYNFWVKFNEMKPKEIAKEIEPLDNVLGKFMNNRFMSAMFSQYDSFDFRKAADQGKIVVINIPEGILQEKSLIKLLSNLINKSIWLDLQSRADIDISKRYPTIWFVDEAHELVDDQFIGVLTKARAYRLGLCLVTQGMNNFRARGMDDVGQLIQDNCKTKIAFTLGFKDARDMCEEFEGLSSNDFQNLPKRHFYGKMLLPNDTVSNPFFGKTVDRKPKLRDYYDFMDKFVSDFKTIDEIEEEVEQRIESLKLLYDLQ